MQRRDAVNLSRQRAEALRSLKKLRKKELEQVCLEVGVDPSGLKQEIHARLVATIDMNNRFAVDAGTGQANTHLETLRRIFRAIQNASPALEAMPYSNLAQLASNMGVMGAAYPQPVHARLPGLMEAHYHRMQMGSVAAAAAAAAGHDYGAAAAAAAAAAVV
eukprot:TRINITY_DN4162_c1_g1_i3.p3 TRINITY_DN4162_c1_g1~~TRINITY_DN4162_c1_g1_i3.p3  ORF type:complete len:162 (-),score=68.23 TRINITY_DN4162_c1_g1_i3:534-1019(-)